MRRFIYVLILFVAITAFTITDNGSKGKFAVVTSEYSASFMMNQGLFNGFYASLYANGKTKAKGRFKGNHRIGEWSFYDNTGTLRAKRKYLSPTMYELLYPELPKEGPAQLFVNPVNIDLLAPITTDKTEFIANETVTRQVHKHNNPTIFENDRFYKVVLKAVVEGKTSAYESGTKTPIGLGTVNERIASYGSDISYYEVQETKAFSLNELASVSKVSMVTPFVEIEQTDKKGNKSVTKVGLFTVEVTNLYELLAQEKLFYSFLPDTVNTLQDVFLYNCFASDVVAVGDVDIRNDNLNADELTEAALKLKVALIENENDAIVYYSPEAKP